MSAQRAADEVRERIRLADNARRRERGADGMLSTIRMRSTGRIVRVETTVRFGGREHESAYEHVIDAGENSALYRALQIVKSEARAEAERYEASVEVVDR